jgi:1,2-beta-oligoglucan phosphorylase
MKTLTRENLIRMESPSGLRLEMNANGSIRRMDCRDILLNLFLGTEIEGGPANLFLRRHGSSRETTPLLGPRSPAAFHATPQGAAASGEWGRFRYTLSLVLARSAPAWFWHLRVENRGTGPETFDLVYAQDLGLAHYGAVRLNEYYVSHYIDHTPLSHPERGVVLASRQNLSMGGKNPWTIIGSLGRGISFATDAMQVYGLATRADRLPLGVAEGLPGSRLQHEHSMAAIQDDSGRIEPGDTAERGFFGWFEPDHAQASSPSDLDFVLKALSLPEAAPTEKPAPPNGLEQARTLFSSAPILEAIDLDESEIRDLFGSDLREEERVDGKLLSFFTGDQNHVVLRAKELLVLRPHAHMLRTGDRWVPDECVMTSTTWMNGVFHSLVTQGHVSINRFLSTVHTYLSLFRENGLRLFVDAGDGWRLLDMPSAYEMAPQGCRWLYKHPGGTISIRSLALPDRHELTFSVDVLSGPPLRFLLSNHVAINGDDGSDPRPVQYDLKKDGVFVRSVPDSDVGRRFPEGGFHIRYLPGTVIERIGGDEMLFLDGCSRNQPFLCIVTQASKSAGFTLHGGLIPESPAGTEGKDPFRYESTRSPRILPPEQSPLARPAARLGEILPWFIQNGLVHYLTPRGIEQYSGGGWGTRDICQGPVEMMLGIGRTAPIRDLLLRVFGNQNADGDWPQWFMFFDRERNIRPGDSHGDIVFWPLLALAQYLLASEDGTLLDEQVPFFHPEGEEKAERAEISRHVERALEVIGKRIIPSTRLAAYGHGDWNDSLQPVQPAMRERLCSTWTVTLQYQTLVTLSRALEQLGRGEHAAKLESTAAAIREDFRRILMKDDTLTGFAYFLEDGRIDYLLHPRDRSTGLSYSLLPMIHAVINDLLTPQEAEHHFRIIREHLYAPDGARLFDKPLEYRGGPQRFFQRAESATFFGREIGLMYTHAHLRYAEALARYGDAEGFFQAICRANPIGIREFVPAATLRQSNCYYSSSDAAFSDRYQASAEYGRILKNEIPLEGGWRVYSSGAGIWSRILFHCFLGVQQLLSMLVIDPVIPRSLDGLRVEIEIAGRPVELLYRVREKGCGPTSVEVNGREIPFTRETNPYRNGAAEIPMKSVLERFRDSGNRMTVILG